MSNPANAAEAFSAFQAHAQESEYAKIRTALLRFTVPGWSKRYPLEKRSSSQVMAKALHFLETISLQQLQGALQVQAEVFEKMAVSESNRRVFKSYLRKFLSWCEEQGWFDEATTRSLPNESASQVPAKVAVQLNRFQSPKGVHKPLAKDLKLSGVPKKVNYALGTVAGDVINTRLAHQLDRLFQFMQQTLGLRPSTRENYRERLLQLLGWFHRYQGVPLDELCLESIVPVVKLKARMADCFKEDGSPDHNKFAIETILAAEGAMQSAQQTDHRLRQYLDFLNGSLSAKLKVLQACINTAKYLYSEQTSDPKQYQDVPMILLTRKLTRSLRQCEGKVAPRIPFEVKSVPWERCYAVVLQLKQEADTVVLYQVAPRRTGGIAASPRKETGIARSYLRFLLVALFVLIPPDRARTIRELELGRTLVWGCLQDGVILPPERTQTPSTARWWLHLQPQDYKTGNAYQTYWGELPNTDFGDGTCFYNYLDRWVTIYRPLFQPNHHRLLVKRNGEPLSRNGMNQSFRQCFFRLTGVPVTPKELRPMYVTYLRHKQANEAVLDAAACAMHHSRTMQNEIYDRQQLLDKQEPIHAFNQRLMTQAASTTRH